jgi:hypothetical protein
MELQEVKKHKTSEFFQEATIEVEEFKEDPNPYNTPLHYFDGYFFEIFEMSSTLAKARAFHIRIKDKRIIPLFIEKVKKFGREREDIKESDRT